MWVSVSSTIVVGCSSIVIFISGILGCGLGAARFVRALGIRRLCWRIGGGMLTSAYGSVIMEYPCFDLLRLGWSITDWILLLTILVLYCLSILFKLFHNQTSIYIYIIQFISHSNTIIKIKHKTHTFYAYSNIFHISQLTHINLIGSLYIILLLLFLLLIILMNG